jgi:copper transport protein
MNRVATAVRATARRSRPAVVRRVLRLSAGLALSLGLLAAGVTSASAHAYLLSSNPGNGAILTEAPRQAILQFSVPVTTRLCTMSLVNASGHSVRGASIQQTDANRSILIIDLPSLPQGAYRIQYTARDNTDLHSTGGAIDFGVGQAAALATPALGADRPSYPETGARWLELAGITLLIGVVTVWLGIVPALPHPAKSAPHHRDFAGTPGRGKTGDGGQQLSMATVRRHLVLLAMLGYAAIVAGKVGQLGVAVQGLLADSGSSLADVTRTVLLGSSFGELWLLGMVLALAVLLAVRVAVRPARSRWHGLGLVAATAALVAVYAQSGHGTNQAGFDPAQIAFRAVHLVAAGVWVGGLTVLVALFLGTLRGGRPEMPVVLAALGRFGGIAIVCVGLLGATGLVLAGKGVLSVNALLTTTYGWTLIVKVATGVVALWIALRTTLALRRRREGSQLSGSLVFEVAALVVVLWGAAALGATPPASAPAPVVPVSAPIITSNTSTKVDELFVDVALQPGRPGPNTMFLVLHGDASVPLRKVDGVRITLRQPGGSPQTFTGNFTGRGRYEFPTVYVANPGQEDVAVEILRTPGPDGRTTFAWPISQPLSPWAQLGLPTTPWAPTLNVLAAVLAAALAVYVAGRAAWAWRRRSTPAASSGSSLTARGRLGP